MGSGWPRASPDRACEASRAALGVDRIQLYQLHAPDPRTPLATSVRALEELQRDGLVEAIGLCNVTVGQIEEARAITDIAVRSGRARACGVTTRSSAAWSNTASRTTSGARPPPARRRASAAREPRRDRVLRDIAARHGATPAEIALAALFDLSDLVTPLPGPDASRQRRRSRARAPIVLDDDDRDRLDERFPGMADASRAAGVASPRRRRADGEVVLIMGLPGAGKSTLARQFVADGYHRLNRDEAGGTLRGLLPALERARGEGTLADSSSTTPT